MRRAFFVGALTLALAAPFAAAAGDMESPPTIWGDWATPGLGSIVSIQSCDSGRGQKHACGRIAWLWDATGKDGAPRRDLENPDPKLRAKPLAGAVILSGFRESTAGVWIGGTVYNPDDGRRYTGAIRVRGDGALELEGCALRIFCQTQTWRRTGELLAALSARQ